MEEILNYSNTVKQQIFVCRKITWFDRKVYRIDINSLIMVQSSFRSHHWKAYNPLYCKICESFLHAYCPCHNSGPNSSPSQNFSLFPMHPPGPVNSYNSIFNNRAIPFKNIVEGRWMSENVEKIPPHHITGIGRSVKFLHIRLHIHLHIQKG